MTSIPNIICCSVWGQNKMKDGILIIIMGLTPMVEVCDFDPVLKEFVIQYTLIQQKDLFLYKIMWEMHGHKIINQNSLHYLTFTVVGWIDVFSNDIYRKIIIDSLIYCQKEKGLKINAYVIMSNHLHLICYTKDPFKLSDIVRDFKKFTSKSILESIQSNVSESRKEWMLRLFSFYAKYNKNNKTYQFWQQDSHPILQLVWLWEHLIMHYMK
jgi:REP element-mobilizing transposase RayT